MDISLKIEEHLKAFTVAPFLFIGSGFSRRYIGLEDWNGMLKKFCTNGMSPFEYYSSKADSYLPLAATHMSDEFSEIWWKNDVYKHSRESCDEIDKMYNKSSPLKYEISNYLRMMKLLGNDAVTNEINRFKSVVVDGIITTNWDCLIEEIFPDYQVYTGQTDLINSNIYEIGEIYKIHGSINEFNTLVLTHEDYDQFNIKNAYLSAKLLSIFVEHPVVFIGYSISDSNIKEILKSISKCLNGVNLSKIENNIIFIEPIFDDKEDSFERSYIAIDEISLPITHIKLKDYSKLYVPLSKYKRKFSVKHLKQIKSHLFEIVKENDPHDRVALLDIDDTTEFDKVDFVLGVGIKTNAERGLIGLDQEDLIEDIIFDNRDFETKDIVYKCLPRILRYQYRTPYLKYIKRLGLDKISVQSATDLDERVKLNYERVKSELKKDTVRKLLKQRSEIQYDYSINTPNLLKAQIVQSGKSSIDLERLKQVLIDNYDEYTNGDDPHFNKSSFRTVVRIYDWLKYSI